MGARLSCHLLLKLFQTVEGFMPNLYSSLAGSTSPLPRSPNTHSSGIKYRYEDYFHDFFEEILIFGISAVTDNYCRTLTETSR